MGERRYRTWTLDEKRRIVARMKSCRHQDLADELKVDRRQLYAWRKQVRQAAEAEYSLASCSPAELASASSATYHAATNNPVRPHNRSERLFWDFCYCLTRRGHFTNLVIR